MAEEVRVSRIEIGGDEKPCRVFLSDGKELVGLGRVAPEPVARGGLLKVQIDAHIGPSKDGYG